MTFLQCKAAAIGVLAVGFLGFPISNAKAQIALPAAAAAAGAPAVLDDLAANHGSGCTNSNTLSRRVDFADLRRARHVLRHRDEWARQLSDFDLGIRQKTAAPTNLREFLAFSASAGLSWTAQEQAGYQALVDELSNAMKSLNLNVPNIDLVKTTGGEEFDAAYTRDRAIILPQREVNMLSTNPRGAYFLLAHELFHVLSRTDSHLRDRLYGLLGFQAVNRFEYPRELEDRRVSNPDAFEYLHTLTVQTASGNVDVLPVIQSLLPLNEAILLPNFFAALDIVLLSVDPRTGKVRRDASGNLIKYGFGNTNWVPLLQRNSNYIIHPEEVLADNFAILMQWRSDGGPPPPNPPVNDLKLLLAIQHVLASGCRP